MKTILFACCMVFLTTLVHAAEPLATFNFEDHLRRAWSNELVFCEVKPELFGRKNVTLSNTDGKPVALQWVKAEDSPRGKPSIAFTADVPELGKSHYDLIGGVASPDTDLHAVDSPDTLELSNSLIALRLHRSAKAITDGPIAGVRLTSGAWSGAGEIKSTQPATKHDLQITANGPVFIDAVATYHFGDKGQWRVRFRLIRNEPVILVEEKFDVPGDAVYRYSPTHGWPVTSVFYRRGNQIGGAPTGRQELWTIGSAADTLPAFVLEPWLHWQTRERQGNWFSVYGSATADMLTLAAIRPSIWVDVDRKRASLPQTRPDVFFSINPNNELTGEFPLLWGSRQWMISALDRDQSIVDLAKPDNSDARNNTPLPQQYVIKHGDFPLDMVKEYVLDWKGDHDNYPRLIVRKADLPAWRKTVDIEAMRPDILRLVAAPFSWYTMENWITPYFATGDEKLGGYLAKNAADMVQQTVDMYTKQVYHPTIGFAPHHQQIAATSLLLADAVMGDAAMTPDVKRRILAQAAFLGYTLDRADYHSPARGFAANPNMTTSALGYKATAACFIPSHPKAKDWAADAIKETLDEMHGGLDKTGGWLEAPHYAMVSYDQILGVLIMARNAGFADDLYDPQMKRIANWFSKISTPPDSRFQGFRHLPPIGNTYMIEPTGEFGIIAYLWREKDPEFAKQMQWMFQQQRSFSGPGIGGSYPALTGYRTVLLDSSIKPEAPKWGSELFPETGVVLRGNTYPAERETMLHMMVGNHRQHYDQDSGAITFWGKGRILCEDYGYYGRAPGEDHSMITATTAPEGAVMKAEEFATDPKADFVRGKKQAWNRSILFVKDADPNGPQYAVIADSLAADDPTAVWRLWTTSNKIDVAEQGAKVDGKEDVDMDVFFAMPAKPAIQQEVKAKTSGAALTPDGKQATYPYSQNGLIIPMKTHRNITAVLFPRLKTEKPATITSLADGKVIHVVSEAGDDWIFLSAEPFKYSQDGIDFEGTVGLVQTRGGKTALLVPSPGKLSAKGQSVTNPAK